MIDLMDDFNAKSFDRKCKACHEPMKWLKPLLLDSSKSYYGCEECKIVLEVTHGPSGETLEVKKFGLNYQEYQILLKK